jgi:signal transduction histidine kinase
MALERPTDTKPEREQTDESLRTERQETDRALAEKQAAVEKDADVVIRHARQQADAVLEAARDKADERLEESGPPPATVAAILDERALEDETLEDERATADETLHRERDETARALSRLFPHEREKTDRYLLTERARSDEALSNRDNFLGIVSHDLRNLLGGIVMSAGLLAETAGDNDERKKMLLATTRIQRYAARMNRLIGDLLDVASIDAGKLAITLARGDAAALIDEAVDTFQGAASAKGLSLDADVGERPLWGHFDRDRILQVLANLVTNAIKFTASGGSIRLSAERVQEELLLLVSDTGAGIPDDMLELVFEPFFQARTNDRKGVGLGLYISRCIVEAHGGTIRAESKVGEGSSFHVTLPDAVPS